MPFAQKCPVCDGSGEYHYKSQKFLNEPDCVRCCHGCGGKGWIVVPESWDCGNHEFPSPRDYSFPPVTSGTVTPNTDDTVTVTNVPDDAPWTYVELTKNEGSDIVIL